MLSEYYVYNSVCVCIPNMKEVLSGIVACIWIRKALRVTNVPSLCRLRSTCHISRRNLSFYLFI